MTLTTPSVAEQGFATFAPYYDGYTDHPLYASWITGIEELARAHGLRGNRVLDLACGTGKSLAPLLDLGYEATGVDVVPEMLAVARRHYGDMARFVEADITELPEIGTFEFITCLNDVCNYVVGGFEPVLRAAAAALAPGGLLAFDANTLLTYRTTFASTHVRETPDAYFVWRGMTTDDFPEGGLARADLDVFAQGGDGAWSRTTSVDLQRHHPLAGLRAAIAAAGLELVCELGQHDDGRRDPAVDERRHLKALYLARRSLVPRREVT